VYQIVLQSGAFVYAMEFSGRTKSLTIILLVVLKDYNLVWLIVLRKTIKLINTINNKDVIILLSII